MMETSSFEGVFLWIMVLVSYTLSLVAGLCKPYNSLSL